MQESIYAVWKHGEYVGEGNARQMAELTGQSERTIRIIATPSYRKAGKKWYAERIVGKFDLFAEYDEVDYGKIKAEMIKHHSGITDIAEVIGIKYQTASLKLNRKIRFRYSELRELEDLFFLEAKTLIKQGGIKNEKNS